MFYVIRISLDEDKVLAKMQVLSETGIPDGIIEKG